MSERNEGYGALCSGIGGLELAVEQVFGFHAAWHAEIDPDAAMIHDRHWPGVPNLGDVKAIDWTLVEPVDLMCFGFPCQDLSHAGKGAGIEEGTRSGLWFDCLRAVRMVRPRVVVVENVSALLTRRDGLDFSIVMAGLAEAGFDAEWISLRASDVGAPHRRERIFLLAQHTDSGGRDPRGIAGVGRPMEGWGDGPRVPAAAPHSGKDAPTDPRRLGSPGRREAGHVAGPSGTGEGEGDQRQRHGDALDHRRAASPDANGGRLQERSEPDSGPCGPGLISPRRCDTHRCDADAADADEQGPQGGEPAGRHVVPAWGDYEPAIRRWERTLGRPAPNPVDGRGRLNPPFVEWMMGYPAGWVDGLKRTAALRCLGNAVVPQQGIAALSVVLAAWQEVAA